MIDIEMVGIDHSRASVAYREAFAFTKAAASEAMKHINGELGAAGCVILSTCNRTELWVARGEGFKAELAGLLCGFKGLDEEEYKPYLTRRCGEEAVTHLLQTACGLKSRVLFEEQIITQVGEALELARACGAADSTLERLFRTAVTAAKRVKTEVRAAAVEKSAATGALELLHRERGALAGASCLIIGNGEIGRLAASALVAEGCAVKMTLRHYKKGEAVIPQGCAAVEYEDRLAELDGAEIIISATSSPHLTLHYDDVLPHLDGTKKIFIDLAVPRDISPRIARENGVSLYDIDSLCDERESGEKSGAVRRISEILDEYSREFLTWYGFRDFVPKVTDISSMAAEDIMNRVRKTVAKLEMPEDRRKELERHIENSSEKVVSKLMFGLRDYLSPDKWDECIESLEKAVQR